MSASDSLTNRVAAGRTLFDFIWDVLCKLYGPISSLFGFYWKENPARELKGKLGEWAGEAKDQQGRWRQPVLTKEAFERHLKANNGYFQPSGECTASFGWAQLLFALNIRPKKGDEAGIISWRLTMDGAGPAQTGTVSLAMDGAVLCHIVNLYQKYTGGTPSADKFQLPFGELRLLNESTHTYAFESFGESQLASLRKPFFYSRRDRNMIREGYLDLERNNVIALYENALGCGISEDRLKLSDTQKPLIDRVNLLLAAMVAVNQDNWDAPYLITPSWIEFASRIKRRATTDGGNDDLLRRHIEIFISNDDAMVARLKIPLRDEGTWQDELTSTLKPLFMLKDDHFEFIWNLTIELSSRINPRFVDIVHELLHEALENLTATDEGTLWARTTSPQVPAEDLVKVLRLPHMILNKPVVVLSYMPDEWNFLVEISG